MNALTWVTPQNDHSMMSPITPDQGVPEGDIFRPICRWRCDPMTGRPTMVWELATEETNVVLFRKRTK